jgi:hypothetical protein
MKQLPLLITLAFSLSLCNLTGRFKKGGNSNSPASGSTAETSGGDKAEVPAPTSAQQAAIANGKTANWDQQGISWILPANWKQLDVRNESVSYSGKGAFLTVAISAMGEDFPTENSIKAMYDGIRTDQKNGKYDDLKWLALDGVRGIEFRESKPERPDDIRRLEWEGYRKFAGQTQLIIIILSSDGANFPKHEDELYGILYSTKITH